MFSDQNTASGFRTYVYLKVLAFYLDALEWDTCFRKGWQKLRPAQKIQISRPPPPFLKKRRLHYLALVDQELVMETRLTSNS